MAKRSLVPRILESSYHHQRLRQNEIRLLTTRCINGTVGIEVDQYEVTEDLEYYAISYVWGSASALVTVTCNGKPLIVTPTALEMLHYLHRYQKNTAIRKFWIDAVCINQEDEKEKSTQIPLMCDIYSRAAAVIVWMGASTPETDVFFAKFQEVREKSKPWVAHFIADPGYRDPTKEVLPCLEEAFWRGFYQLLDNEWFTRLWTYQEIILPSTATLLCGDSWADFDEFVDFLMDGWYNSDLFVRTSGVGPSTTNITAARTCHSIKFYRDRNARSGRAMRIETRNVGTELYSLRSRHVKEPVDRVWAMVGLLEKDFRDKITSAVDYSAQGRNEYWKTWIMFAKALVDEPGGLKLLRITPTLESRLPYLPTWCPNLSGTSACRRIIHGQWNRPVVEQHGNMRWTLFEENSKGKSQERARVIMNHNKMSINTVGYDDMLRIRGFVVDTVEEVINHEKPLDREHAFYDQKSEEHMVLYDTAVDRHLASLDLARRVFCGNSESVTDVPDDFIIAVLIDCRITQGAKNVYRELLPKLTTWYPESEVDHTWEQMQFHQQWVSMRGHTFFSTTGGRIGYAHPGCQPGDQVAAFYGGEALYMIRQLDTTSHDVISAGKTSDHVQYCGAAFIPHLMEQHQRDAVHIGPDTTFFIH